MGAIRIHPIIEDCAIETLPESIGTLPNLQYLWLYDNSISVLPENIGNLTQLREIILSNNRLSSLPSSFKRLTNLTSISLSYNQFESFPLEIADLSNVAGLGLSGNQINAIPKEIRNMKSLIEVDVKIPGLKDAEELFNLPRIENIVLADNSRLDLSPECKRTARERRILVYPKYYLD